ncbi:polyhydroxyalkanoate synthesis repressor PhaR [Rhodovarius crocodyli]|uniref:Polyhydroxyalkanoate synthesis repressor PhaR n=1 Tax=Rhodovarius crocodyli TaxID=1979269 RepID=A0A437MJ11_9PROT|nr:polyhydroxyalkanoate synthesis repressor PhaR [Rhodovarius crocodyli]RVT97640.1 polyhydroxyalkanoate synthesis repressor PhaR [Rhodovarius crocodyli]
MADTGKDTPTPPVVVKKYANRRLYNTESSSYVTLEDLALMIRQGRDFVVYDAKSGEDITRSVLTQIIVEEEAKGTSLLPEPFLRQLIQFYGDQMGGLVPRYLEAAMGAFTGQQDQWRQQMQSAMGGFNPFDITEISRNNMAMIERAMGMFNPFAGVTGARSEVDELKAEVARLKAELAKKGG